MTSPLRLSRRASVQAGLVGLASLSPVTGLARAQETATPTPGADGITSDSVARAVNALDGIVADAQAATGVPGVSVAVVYQDEALVIRGYGVTSTETGDAVDADTIFQLASLSKPLASTVVASIVGDGLVDWDTPIVDHLPEFALYEPWVTSQVTIRDMLCHRSGLADHGGDVLEDIGYERDEILHRLRYLPPESSFRSTYAYTNFGFTAGAVAASNAAGMSWEDAVVARLYEPAGMTRTSSRFDDYIADGNRAHGHVPIDGEWLPEYVRNPDPESPAGGVSSTATDMAQWLRLQLGNGTLGDTEIVAAAALAETHRPQMIKAPPPADPNVDHAGLYALGWNVGYGNDGAVTFSHSGAFALGSGTTVFLLPAEGLGISVLTNGKANGMAEAVALGFLDVARTGAVQVDYVSALAPVFAELSQPAYGKDVDYTVPPTNAMPPQALDSYTGRYHNDYIGHIEITADGEQLTLSQGPTPDTYPMTHWNRDTFTYLPIGENQNTISAVTFTIGPDGTASQVTVEALDTHGMGTLRRDDGAE